MSKLNIKYVHADIAHIQNGCIDNLTSFLGIW